MADAKVAIVTGGSRGIGAAIALNLLSEGMHVVVADNNLTHTQFSLEDEKRVLFVKTDVSSESSVKKMIQQTLKKWNRIDFLINNAGILPDNLDSIEKTSLNTWNNFINTNLTGAFLCSKYAIPSLRQYKGAIVNIASTRALQSEAHDAAYSSTKGGLVALTHAMAINLGPEIRVNCISPGWIDTQGEKLRKIDHQQHPVGRVGRPEDIAYMVSFLISDKAGFITGQNFVVDGGMTVKMIYK